MLSAAIYSIEFINIISFIYRMRHSPRNNNLVLIVRKICHRGLSTPELRS